MGYYKNFAVEMANNNPDLSYIFDIVDEFAEMIRTGKANNVEIAMDRKSSSSEMYELFEIAKKIVDEEYGNKTT